MAIPAPADGRGTTLTFAGFVANLIDVSGPDMKRKEIDTTNMASTVTHTSMPEELYDAGNISCTVEFDPSYIPPITGAMGTLAITWGSAVSATWTYTNAYMTSFKTGAKIGARMEASATFKLNGAPVIS